MKYTSLFSAVAIAAAMGTTALATVETNNTASIDFEGNGYPVGTMASAQLTGWTVQTEDQSEIIAAPLTSQDAIDGYTANKHLKLNTEGQELTWVPGTYTEKKAIVEMKVRLVASDTAPAISGTDIHAAVYLKVDENNPSDDGLYAYTSTGWQKLDTSSLTNKLETGATVALRVLMDYTLTARNVTYEGALLTGAENEDPVYYPLCATPFLMANQDTAGTQGALASISFKGTGGVDDLFVGEIKETASTANVILEMFQGGEWQGVDEGTVDTANAALAYTYSPVEVPAGKVAVVTVLDDQKTTTLATLENVIDSLGNLEVSCANYAFVAGNDYYIRVAFTDPAADLDDFAIGDDDTQAALATAGVDPVAVDGNYFIVNVIEPNGATASLLGSATLGGTFTDVNATRTEKTGYTELKYAIPANETAKFFKVKFTK